ncbi:hypothetical protein AX14_008070, partial [Amanita brunnescens Koide BX004]
PWRAKADALDKAIWKQLAPGGSHKRKASTMGTPTEPVRGKKTKTVKAVQEKNVAYDERVSIPVPPAPRKARKSVGQASSTKELVAGHSKVIVPISAPKLARTPVSWVASAKRTAANSSKGSKDSSDGENCESSVTESDVPWPEDEEIESSETESDNGPNEANTNNNGMVSRPTAADKRFMDKQVFWSEKENKLLPGSSSTVATPKFVIVGEPIDISDDDEVNNSPTAPANSPVIEPLQSANIPNMPPALVSTTLAAQGLTAPRWPWYTNIITSSTREILLSLQTYELKLVIRKAISLIEGCVWFDHAFPTIDDRNTWNRSALQDACIALESMTRGSDVKFKYVRIKERIEVDDLYVSDISTLLNPCVSLLRGDTKAAAVINARAAYGLHGGSAHLVQTLLQRKQYIYPRALQ